MMQTVLMGWS